jgi:hypothetical protein
MSATPPGVEELDPADLDTDELEKRFAAVEGATVESDQEDDPRDPPPATPEGHHQTHGAPVGTDSTSVTGN